MKHKILTLALLIVGITKIYAQTAAQKISALPITVNTKGTNATLVFYLTGDGGMNSFSTKLIENLAAHNYKVIALDSKKYFWEEKAPEKMSKELSGAIDHYLKQTNTVDFALLGYSFGADASIFLAANLPSSLSGQLKGIVLLSPSMATDLEVKVSDLIGFGNNVTGKYKTLVTARKLTKPIFCVAGVDEENSFYDSLSKTKLVNKKTIPGSHKYNNNVSLVAATIVNGLTSF
ncbi:type IV secretory pathway VirJ component [Pedobacter sp. UYP30]|uniref:AcvB/VirJ family lysyl-phosphatidylglycerol hydrolase n=1 Tax=Pedobacter sp. UYP30 TaxID=1756400 RepID=UPI003395FFDF